MYCPATSGIAGSGHRRFMTWSFTTMAAVQVAAAVGTRRGYKLVADATTLTDQAASCRNGRKRPDSDVCLCPH